MLRPGLGRLTGGLALVAFLAQGAGAPAAPDAGPAPTAVAPDAIVANVGVTMVISVPVATADHGTPQRPRDVEESRKRIQGMLGFDLFDLKTLAAFSPDPERKIVMSWGVVDPAQLRARLEAPSPPAPTDPFAIRFRLTLPVTDQAAAGAALDKMKIGAECARPRRGEPKGAWANWLKRVNDAEDRRAAETLSAAYVCLGPSEAVVARLEPAAREVRWSFAIGLGGRLAAAAAPFAGAPAETERLSREGLFAGRGSFRATPDDEARYRAAMLLFKLSAGFQGLDAESRKLMWPQAVVEMGSFARLVESPPRLFSEVLLIGGTTTWVLTPKGAETFGSLKVRWPAAPEKVFAALGRTVRPGGAFASGAVLDENLHQAEDAADELLARYLWPHLAGFAAVHPRDSAPSPALPFQGDRLELDRAAQRLRLRPD